MPRSQAFRRWTVIRKWYIVHPTLVPEVLVPPYYKLRNTSENRAEDTRTRLATRQRPRKHFESGGALAKRGLLYMTKIKRFYIVHEPNENFWKYGVCITSEMAFTESLLLQKGHFLASKRGRSFKKYIFRSVFKWGTLAQKKDTFFTFKKVEGHMPPLHPPPLEPG
jgi:hypothetical protein